MWRFRYHVVTMVIRSKFSKPLLQSKIMTTKNKQKGVYSQMTQIIQSSSQLLISNSNDFWEGDRKKIAEANPGFHLWIVSTSHTDFFRIGSYPSQKTLNAVLRNSIQTYGRNYVQFYKVQITGLNNHIPKRWERPQGSLQRLTYETAVEFVNDAFTQLVSA